jgi:hypothetical protein
MALARPLVLAAAASLAAVALPSNAATVTVPIEVLGPGLPASPTVRTVTLDLPAAQAGATTTLWFTCHRCGFYGAPEYEAVNAPPPKVKASVRVLGAAGTESTAWVDIDDAHVTLDPAERLHGGINGGLYTAHISLALDAATRGRLAAGTNRVQFRFNGTDGETDGFRVLDLQFRNEAGQRTDDTTIVHTDPLRERTAGSAWSADADAGRTLWYAADQNIKSPIVPRTLHASCSSCHAEDGRDLQYFNYSNNAIATRAAFHGLTAKQGKQIAAYIRYSQRDVPYAEKGRPWNPPYQPGPGLDCTGTGCETQWAAGAGLEAVLTTPKQAVRALFGMAPDGTDPLTQADIDRVMDPAATLNVRETPVPLQFPDWNAWLPTIHPDDIWEPGAADGSFQDGARFSGSGDHVYVPDAQYEAITAWLKAHAPITTGDWSTLSAADRDDIQTRFTAFGWEAYGFLGGGRGNHIAGNGLYGAQVGANHLQARASTATMALAPASGFTNEAFIERAMASVMHWAAVKQWEWSQAFHLEGDQRNFIGDRDTQTGTWQGRGEAHGWPFNTPGPFYLAPHMLYQTEFNPDGSTKRDLILGWEAGQVPASYYRTNQWYQLQMTVNAGAQSGWVNYPMDWPYLTGFDEYLGNLVGDADTTARDEQSTHFTRLLQARIKAAQYVHNDLPLYDPSQPDLVANIGRYGRAQAEKHLSPVVFMDNDVLLGVWPSKFRYLDNLQPGLLLEVVNGAIAQFNGLYASTDASAWRRCDPANTMLGDSETYSGFRYCLDATREPLGVASDGRLYMREDPYYRRTTEQTDLYGVVKAKQMGAEPTRVATYEAWVNRMWPGSP